MDKIDEVRKNKESLGGYKMKIVEYNGKDDITVEFQDEYNAKVHTGYNNFKNGSVKNPYHPSVFNIGYIGQGKYKVSENGKNTVEYIMWYSMLQRCYDPYYINKEPTYINVEVCKEGLNFQNFAKWYNENKYGNEKLHLDKDILVKGNKIYSPETCILLPERINKLFVKCDAKRGMYPIGVHWDKDANKFKAQCSILDENGKKKTKNLGRYNTSKDAFISYKVFKESYIKQVADEYKDLIPQKLYNAMYKWEVEIDD